MELNHAPAESEQHGVGKRRARSKQEDREHSRRKHKRRKERGWNQLKIILDGVAEDAAEPVQQLASTAEAGEIDWSQAPTGVAPAAVNRRAEIRNKRKINQIEGFIQILGAMFDPNEALRLVDFGCGSGNLIVPLAWRFPKWSFVGIDMKDKCIELLMKRATMASLPNVQGVVGMAANAPLPDYKSFDVALALHACGSATDDVLRRATASNIAASFIVSPCCAGKLYNNISDGTLHGISRDNFAVIASFADHAATATAQSGEMILQRKAKNLMESVRLEFCRRLGYNTALLHLTNDHDYPKNDVLIGRTCGLPLRTTTISIRK